MNKTNIIKTVIALVKAWHLVLAAILAGVSATSIFCDLRSRRFLYLEQGIRQGRSMAFLAMLSMILTFASFPTTHSVTDAASLNQNKRVNRNEWTRILPDEPITEVAIDPTNPNIIYAGSDVGALFKTTDDGATWTSGDVVANGYSTSLAIDFVNPNNVYAGTSAGAFKSIDGGATWNFLNVGGGSILMDPQSPNTLFAFGSFASNHLWKTTDGGSSWSALQTGSLHFSGYGSAISLSDPQTLYTLGSDYAVPLSGEVHKSTDGGTSWSPAGAGLIAFGITDIAVDPINPNIVFASGYQEMFKSTDGGANWLNISEGLVLFPDTFITSIAISPTDANSLYIGTFSYDYSNGVFHSPNGGASWSEFNDGLSYLYILELEMDSSGTSLYAATFAGVFRYQLAPTCTAQISPTNQFFSSMGGAGLVNVTTGDECSWAVSNNDNWIIITSAATGAGPGTVTYKVRENFTGSSRSGVIVIAGRNFTVVQDGGLGEDCEYSISPQFQGFSASGGKGLVSVLANNRCAWSVISNVSWITITSNPIGIGNEVVTYSVVANPNPSGRKGTITIGAQTFTVKQKGNGL